MSTARQLAESIRDVLRSWGRDEPRGAVPRGRQAKVLVYWRVDNKDRLVGSLTYESDEYVFRYDAAFRDSDLPAIAAFPDKDREYRERQLWPFFSVRLPPLKRVDIQPLIVERKLQHADTLQLLGVLGRKTITTPYELQYVAP